MNILRRIMRFCKRSMLTINITALVIMTVCGALNSEGVIRVSGSSNGEIIKDLTAEAKPDVNQTFSKSEEEVTKSEKVIASWEEFETYDHPLIAAIPDRNIFLYANKINGVVLQWNEEDYEFKWPYLTSRFILPRMLLSDFDADRIEELAVILYVGSGTGVSIEELPIVEKVDGQIVDRLFSPDDYIEQLQQTVEFKTYINDEEIKGEITISNDKTIVSMKEYPWNEYGKVNKEIIIGDIVRFGFQDNKLKAEVGFGINGEYMNPPIYIGYLHADVEFNSGEFMLNNIRFVEN